MQQPFPPCRADFRNTLCHHVLMNYDFRSSVKDYRRDKNLKILTRAGGISMNSACNRPSSCSSCRSATAPARRWPRSLHTRPGGGSGVDLMERTDCLTAYAGGRVIEGFLQGGNRFFCFPANL